MPNTREGLQEYRKFYLSNSQGNSIKVSNIIGWLELGGLDAMRNAQYHGVLTKVSKEISFNNSEKEFILSEYRDKGILGKIILTVFHLEEGLNGDIKWNRKYIVYADFNTLKIKNDILSILFNSNALMDLIDSYEDEEFEIERTQTVDNIDIPEIQEDFIQLNGRSLLTNGAFISERLEWRSWNQVSNGNKVILGLNTEVISQGPARQTTQEDGIKEGNFFEKVVTSSNLFYDNAVEEEADNALSFSYKIGKIFLHASETVSSRVSIVKWSYNEGNANYDFIEEYVLYQRDGIPGYLGLITPNNSFDENIFGTLKVNVGWNEGLMLCFVRDGQGISNYKLEGFECSFGQVAFFEPSPKIRFNFLHDVLSRLMLIITGRSDLFYSSVLGRTEIGYDKNGDYSFVGFLSGLWSRDFKKTSRNYKSPKISLKDALDSCCNIFNLGTGIEDYGSSQRLVLEDLEYFYKSQIGGFFTSQISNVEREVDSQMFYSGLEFGYEKVQKLDQEMGLDEPNVKSNFVTPIYKSTQKFNKLSKIRTDEYKLETLRRKPVLKFPDEQLSGDEDNWLLDLKPSDSQEDVHPYKQVHWSDRLSKEPTGIHDPESFTSMIFTPMRMLLRLSSIFNSGMYLFKNKFVNFISSSSNRELSMQFKGEEEIKESDNIKISKLKRPIFKNEIIKFTHPYDEYVENLINGKTKTTVNGKERLVPNFYFKQEWVNEKGDIERGYFLKYEYSDNPTFEFLIANEEII